jgi:hypothetical protein
VNLISVYIQVQIHGSVDSLLCASDRQGVGAGGSSTAPPASTSFTPARASDLYGQATEKNCGGRPPAFHPSLRKHGIDTNSTMLPKIRGSCAGCLRWRTPPKGAFPRKSITTNINKGTSST